ncbi:carotenoid oxygenase [Mytilinidion resinicola]|uniref:Carotenoid oxygenase n=1 Tax=Mytilinidion resinicola TaxID=574789 RepID=A0A6A6XYE8_9PEZI|nr:carotenoid oxygenase [Mytilinidion resinicola]KAF2801522.1 carotenoid oxygenase [Mytilinidion resinicola]
MAGHFRSTHPRSAFPDLPQFSGFMKPCRFEGEVQNLEIRGEIPSEVDGTFYRVMPDPQLSPLIENDPWFNGDGNISAFRIKDGHCHFKQKYVRTEKFVKEREAKRALLGKYRNKFTDAVEFKVRSTANTNVLFFNGRLLACKEDSPPYSLDPETLETIGLEGFDGQLPCLTFTAHPKLDGDELLCFGYEAKGDGTPDVCYFTIDSTGKFTETVWLVAPIVAMIHDFAITKNWVLFPIIPQICDFERMKKGGEYCYTVNAYEDDSGNLVFDLPLTDKNTIAAKLLRFTFDPHSTDLDLPESQIIGSEDCEFPRIDERFSGKRHVHAFFDLMDPRLGTDFGTIAPRMGGGHPLYNALGHLDYKSMKIQKYFPGRTHLVQEPVFIPRKGADTAEGDGWVVALVNNYATMGSELHIVDTRDFEKSQAVIDLPVRLRAGLHGNWVDA